MVVARKTQPKQSAPRTRVRPVAAGDVTPGHTPAAIETHAVVDSVDAAQGKRLPETISTGALTAMGIGAIAIGLPKTVTTGPLGATGTAQ